MIKNPDMTDRDKIFEKRDELRAARASKFPEIEEYVKNLKAKPPEKAKPMTTDMDAVLRAV